MVRAKVKVEHDAIAGAEGLDRIKMFQEDSPWHGVLPVVPEKTKALMAPRPGTTTSEGSQFYNMMTERVSAGSEDSLASNDEDESPVLVVGDILDTQPMTQTLLDLETSISPAKCGRH